jgi:hypothetical protein
MADAGPDGTYPPLDVPKDAAEGVWIVDSGPHRALGMPLPIRMTAIRLPNNDLWLHSPTRCTDDLRSRLERHGRIRHLVAPDVAHWSYLEEWQRACPDAVTWAAPGLRERRAVRRSGARIDRVLDDAPPPEWAGAIEQVIVPGVGFSEVDFFHRESRTLVVTDLVQNIETERWPALARMTARLSGVAAPQGGTPLYLRLAVWAKRREAAEAAARMIAWAPERVIICHGRLIDRDGTQALRRSLAWLLPA